MPLFPPHRMAYRILKRSMDLAIIVLCLPLALPLGLLLAGMIRLDTQGPILFSQDRVGHQGRIFRLLKFRTLRHEPHDPKNPEAHTTRVGHWLRRYALDELPQLWHILRGEMSLVGPRPILPAETQHYTPRQQQRLSVRPGLTGWAQINGRNTLTWTERVEHDVWYVEHRHLGLDFKILIRTPRTLLSGEGVYGPGNHDPDAADVTLQRHPSS